MSLWFFLHESAYEYITVQQSRQFFKFSFFCWLLLGLVFWPRLGDPSVCQSPIGVYVCPFQGLMLGSTYSICSYGQILISCTSHRGSPCPYHYNRVFTPALADGFSLEFKWQKITSSLQDSSQYSGRSYYNCSLYGLYLSSYLQICQSLDQSFGNFPSAPTTIGITVTFMLSIVLFSSKVSVLISLFTFFYFHYVVCYAIRSNQTKSKIKVRYFCF